jgi:type 1 fimbria pilin
MNTKIIKQMKQIGSLAAIVLVLAAAMFAQSNTGTITGQVQDVNGAIVPNATVTVTNLGTSETRTVQTNDEGFYSAESLSTGRIR